MLCYTWYCNACVVTDLFICDDFILDFYRLKVLRDYNFLMIRARSYHSIMLFQWNLVSFYSVLCDTKLMVSVYTMSHMTLYLSLIFGVGIECNVNSAGIPSYHSQHSGSKTSANHTDSVWMVEEYV